MRLRNFSDHQIKNADLGVDVAPGGECDVAEGYALPGRTAGGQRKISTVEALCPGLEPSDAAYRAKWKETPTVAPVTRKSAVPRTVAEFVRDGKPRGVAEILAAREAARFREVPSVEEVEAAGYARAKAAAMVAEEVERARNHARPYTEVERDADDESLFVGYDADGNKIDKAAERVRAMAPAPEVPAEAPKAKAPEVPAEAPAVPAEAPKASAEVKAPALAVKPPAGPPAKGKGQGKGKGR